MASTTASEWPIVDANTSVLTQRQRWKYVNMLNHMNSTCKFMK